MRERTHANISCFSSKRNKKKPWEVVVVTVARTIKTTEKGKKTGEKI